MAAARDPGVAPRSVVRRAVAALAAAAALLAPALVAPPAGATSHDTGDLVVSVVVPITAPWGDGGFLDAETLATATSPTGVLTHELDEVLSTSATIALDPMILASVRLLGTAAPDTAVDWLARLEGASNDVFLLAYADADLAALARADSLDLAEPLGLEFALDPAAFGPPQTATPTPEPTGTPQPDDDPPPPPTTEELLAWPDTIGRIAWPAEGTTAAGDLEKFDAADYEAVLLGSANVSQAGTAHVDIDGFPGLVSDSAASELLRAAAATIDATARQDVVRRLGLTLDGLAAANPGRTVVLTLDRTPTFSIPGLAETLGTLAARDSTRVSGLSAVLTADTETATIVEAPAGPVVDQAPALTDALRAEQAFATILTDPRPLVVPRQLALLKLLTVQNLESDAWQDDADAFLARSAEILRSVTIVDTQDVFVTSSNTYVPVRVANALEFPVTVMVDARPLRPLLRIESPAELTVEPGSSRTINLVAQAIANGEVVVEVTISSPATGAPIAPVHRLNADLQAQWETVGIIVGIIVALVFAAGIVRNVVLRRRAAARERAHETADA
jgi:hypothetical protein